MFTAVFRSTACGLFALLLIVTAQTAHAQGGSPTRSISPSDSTYLRPSPLPSRAQDSSSLKWGLFADAGVGKGTIEWHRTFSVNVFVEDYIFTYRQMAGADLTSLLRILGNRRATDLHALDDKALLFGYRYGDNDAFLSVAFGPAYYRYYKYDASWGDGSGHEGVGVAAEARVMHSGLAVLGFGLKGWANWNRARHAYGITMTLALGDLW